MFAGLLQFVSHLRDSGQLLVVEREVDPRFELNAVLAKIQAGPNLPVLFERVRDTPYPLLTNALGNYGIVSGLLGVQINQVAARWSHLTQSGSAVSEAYPTSNSDWNEIAFSELPRLVYCEKDAGPYFTAGVVVAEDPDSKVVNLSYHRLQIISDTELRGRLTPSGDLNRIQQRVESRGEKLPIAIAIGMPPALMLAAAAKAGPDRSEYDFAARLSGKRFPLLPSPRLGVPVPAAAEFLLEGYILPRERRPEGPFGEWMGYYVPVSNNHVFEIIAVHARKNGIFYSITSGAREEQVLIALPVAGSVYTNVRPWVPTILDVTCFPYTQYCVLQIKKQFEGQPNRAMMAAFGANLNHLLYCIVVDEDVDIHNWLDVLWAMGTRCRPDTIIQIPSIPSFPRDPHRTHWGRIGIDATKPLAHPEEFERRKIPSSDGLKWQDYVKRPL